MFPHEQQTKRAFFWINKREHEMIVNGLHLYSAFLTSGHSKPSIILPITHTFTHQRLCQLCKVTASSSGAVRGVLLRTPSHSERPGIELATFRLPANRLYLLSHMPEKTKRGFSASLTLAFLLKQQFIYKYTGYSTQKIVPLYIRAWGASSTDIQTTRRRVRTSSDHDRAEDLSCLSSF